MKLSVKSADVWSATIEDRAGGAAEKLVPLAEAGANFEFVLARRTPEQPGRGVIFVAPIKGKKVTAAAQNAGFQKPYDLHAVRLEGTDKPGLGAKITKALGDAGISFRGLSGTAIGRKFVAYLALDTADDAQRAISVLKKLS
jgi:hypothetical protein